MAAAGGHWVKAKAGPYAGKMAFVPAVKDGTWQWTNVNGVKTGIEYKAMYSGQLVAVQTSGGWQVLYQNPNNGDMMDAGVYASKQLAKSKMTQMNAHGMAKALNEKDGKNQYNIAKVAAMPKKTSPVVVTPGKKNVKAETAAAQAQVKASSLKGEPSTTADFNALKHQVEITTIMGKKEAVEGVLLEGGALGVTKNPNTGQYHLVDAVSGKTIEKYSTAEAAFAGAKAEAKGMVNFKAPPNPDYKPFNSAKEGEKIMTAGYKSQQLTQSEISTIGKFQNNSGYANDYLWSGNTSPFVAKMDAVLAKTKLPVSTQLIRGESTGHPLYKMAKHLSVGDTYHAKGFDCTSLNPNHQWGGNQVKLIYRAPKGIPAVFGNHYTGKYHSEYEVTLGRNLNWKVVGKTVHNGNITLTLDYIGIEQ